MWSPSQRLCPREPIISGTCSERKLDMSWSSGNFVLSEPRLYPQNEMHGRYLNKVGVEALAKASHARGLSLTNQNTGSIMYVGPKKA